MMLHYLFLPFMFMCYCEVKAEAITELSCIPIRDCHYIYNFTKISTNAEDIFQLLKRNHCGLDKSHQPKVWCKIVKAPQNCSTGICLPKDKCHINIDSEWITKSNTKENECGEDNTYVCCPTRKNKVKNDVFPLPGECGIHPDGIKIYSGQEAELDEFPWMGILQYKKGAVLKQACGASLINREFLITAAHCVDPVAIKAKGYEKLDSVVLGEYNTETEIDCIEYDEETTDCADKPIVVPIKSVELHPEWNFEGGKNDIAILKLLTRIDYTDFIKPICLPLEGWMPAANDYLFISGWGKSPTERRTAVKMKATVRQMQCSYANTVTQICAGGRGRDICSGDSGGPLMFGKFVNKHYFMFLGGIASFGIRQCGIGPSVYTFVPSYLDWIRSTVEK